MLPWQCFTSCDHIASKIKTVRRTFSKLLRNNWFIINIICQKRYSKFLLFLLRLGRILNWLSLQAWIHLMPVHYNDVLLYCVVACPEGYHAIEPDREPSLPPSPSERWHISLSCGSVIPFSTCCSSFCLLYWSVYGVVNGSFPITIAYVMIPLSIHKRICSLHQLQY